MAESDLIIQLFMHEALPRVSEATRETVGHLITSTLGAVGAEFSESLRTSAKIMDYADAMADMFCAYLDSLWDQLNFE